MNIRGIDISATDYPEECADAWICLRTAEAGAAPDPERTVVCLHDLYNDPGLYHPGGIRGGVHAARGLALCHPLQRLLLLDAGVALSGKVVLERPLGALSAFVPRAYLPEKFCIGWVGRNDYRKRTEWIAEIASLLSLDRSTFRFLLLGRDLAQIGEQLRAAGFECEVLDKELHPITEYPALYAVMDCLCITSITEAGPLTLFEALATGLPVVSTPVGWAPHFAGLAPECVLVGNGPADLAAHLADIFRRREQLFAERHAIAGLVEPWNLDGWFRDVVRLAAGLAPHPVPYAMPPAADITPGTPWISP